MRTLRVSPFPASTYSTPQDAIAASRLANRRIAEDAIFPNNIGSTVRSVSWSDDSLRLDTDNASLLVRAVDPGISCVVIPLQDGPRPKPHPESMVRMESDNGKSFVWHQGRVAEWIIGHVVKKLFYNDALFIYRANYPIIMVSAWRTLDPDAASPWLLHWDETE